MKTKRTKPQSVQIALIASIIVCFLFIPKNYSIAQETSPIDVVGEWNDIDEDNKTNRSLPTIPITVYLWNTYINIQNDNPDCDITVRIVNLTTGIVAYQQVFQRMETANIFIPIGNLAAGGYRIELTGPGTRHLEGVFRN